MDNKILMKQLMTVGISLCNSSLPLKLHAKTSVSEEWKPVSICQKMGFLRNFHNRMFEKKTEEGLPSFKSSALSPLTRV